MPDEDIRGLTELLKIMEEELPRVLRVSLIRKALRAGAELCRVLAAKLAPNDPKTAGSRIAESMSVMITDLTSTGGIALTGPSKHGFPGIWAEKGSKHQKATPFLQPAFDQTVDDMVETMGTVLGDGIEEAWAA